MSSVASGRRRGAADRVARAHAQARSTVRLAVGFVVAAAVAVPLADASWVPLHLFLAGGLVLAISAVSLMLTVTWSAAPAPVDGWVALQRACIAGGVVGIAVGRELSEALLVVSAVAHTAGLVLLAVLLAVTVRRGVERRFDPAVVAYVAALAAGVAGACLGAVMGSRGAAVHWRSAHIALNVLGLVGLVVGGTLPFFAATVGRSRMHRRATRRRLVATVLWLVGALVLAVVGIGLDHTALARIGTAAYALGIVGVVSLLPTPTRRQLVWAGPRLVGLWAGAAWWAAAVVAAAVTLVPGEGVVFPRPWLLALVVAGYGQILWGSLAYLLPMLRGGGHVALAEGFAATRSWPGLVAANVAGLALVAGAPRVAVAAAGVWVADTIVRAARVDFGRRRARPPAAQAATA